MNLHRPLACALTLFCSLSVQSMDKKIDDQHRQKIVDTARSTNAMLHYLKENNLTLANASAALQEQWRDEYYKTVHAPIKLKTEQKTDLSLDRRKALLIFVAVPYVAQSIILTHMDFKTPIAQESFFSKPLYEALEWHAEFYNNRGLYITDINTYLHLNFDQLQCINSVVSNYLRKRDPSKYVDEDEQKPLNYYAFATQAQKQLLLTLPQEFTQESEANMHLTGLTIAEKPSIFSKIINTPLAVFFRSTQINNALNFKQLFFSRFSIISGLMLASYGGLIATSAPTIYLRNLFFTTASMYFTVCLQNKFNTPNVSTVHIATKVFALHTAALCGGLAIPPTCFFIGSLLDKQPILMPFKTIFTHTLPLQLLLTVPFAAYDLYKYGKPKYAVKTQSITQLIEAHKNPERKPFCALL